MSRAPVKEKLITVLEQARTTEPYPVWVTWPQLARSVYGFSSDRNILNLRRTASKTPGVTLVTYTDTGKPGGAILTMTNEEGWLRRETLKVMGVANYAADSRIYRKPSRDDVVTAFQRGLYDDVSWINVATLTALVNRSCDTSFDPSEVAWESEGIERRKSVHKRELMELSASALGRLLRKRYAAEVERRMVTVGPYRVDPVQPPANCPCCLQEIRSGLPLQRSGSIEGDYGTPATA